MSKAITNLNPLEQPRWSTDIRRSGVVAALGACFTLPLLVACGDNDTNKTVGQKLDAAVATTEQTASNLKESAKVGVEQAQAALREGAEDAKLATQRANEIIVRDSDDTVITASVNAGLLKDPDLSAIKIDVDTRKGVVSLYGPAPSAAAKDRANTIAMAVKGVTRVDNYLTVKGS
jgi:hyperosmotically inducible protein